MLAYGTTEPEAPRSGSDAGLIHLKPWLREKLRVMFYWGCGVLAVNLIAWRGGDAAAPSIIRYPLFNGSRSVTSVSELPDLCGEKLLTFALLRALRGSTGLILSGLPVQNHGPCGLIPAATRQIPITVKPILIIVAVLVAAQVDAETFKHTRSIPLPQVEGRIDHLSIDADGGRLFVAALGNNTIEIVDLRAGKVARSLSGFSEPQGVLFVPELNRLYVANGGDGSVRIFDATTFESVTTLQFDDDADNLRYDAAAKQVYVGYGSGALGIIDATKNTIIGTVPLTAHPESFQLEKNGSRLFVNVPRSHTIAVIERRTRRVIGHWSLGLVAANFPMALDERNHRAFIASRAPARLLVFDTESGKEIAKLDLHGDCDDLFFDAARHQVYASCGEGFIDVFTQSDANHYALREAVKTRPRARTCYFDGERIYLAVPAASGHDAQIDVYEIGL